MLSEGLGQSIGVLCRQYYDSKFPTSWKEGAFSLVQCYYITSHTLTLHVSKWT